MAAKHAVGAGCVSEKYKVCNMRPNDQVLSTAMSEVLVHATELVRMVFTGSRAAACRACEQWHDCCSGHQGL